jgi:hypothetical protein
MLELHQLARGALACELLADRGLGLFADSSAGLCIRNQYLGFPS